MNEQFAQATTSVAFSLQLSKIMVNTLLRVALNEMVDAEDRKEYWGVVQVHHLQALERRGLVYWKYDAFGRCEGFGGLTQAGHIVCALVQEAGLSIENTNTPLVQKRLERANA